MAEVNKGKWSIPFFKSWLHAITKKQKKKKFIVLNNYTIQLMRWRSGWSVRFAFGKPGVQSPCRVIPKDQKMVSTAFLLGARHFGRLWRTSRQVRLLCPWARHLTGRPTFMWKTGDPDISQMAIAKRVPTFHPKYSNTIGFLVNGG